MLEMTAGTDSSSGDVLLPPLSAGRAQGISRPESDESVLVPPFFAGAAVSESAAEQDIPADAFFIPEGADHVPTGIDPAAAQPAEHRVRATPESNELADRLEAVARRLRNEDPAALAARLATGDSFETLIAGVLAGFLAARKQ